MLLDANYEDDANCWVVNLYGEVDIYNASKLKTELQSIIQQKNANIILNCENLKYIDSTRTGGACKYVEKSKRI